MHPLGSLLGHQPLAEQLLHSGGASPTPKMRVGTTVDSIWHKKDVWQ